MGTNYYVHYNICSCCGRYNEIHIGKSSYGWAFTFHAVDDYVLVEELKDPKLMLAGKKEIRLQINSFQDWKDFIDRYVSQLEVAKIFDEYNIEVNPSDFYSLIKDKQKERNVHAIQYSDDFNFLDKEGYSFSKGEFS